MISQEMCRAVWNAVLEAFHQFATFNWVNQLGAQRNEFFIFVTDYGADIFHFV